MAIMKITKQIVEDAKKAREAAIKKDPDFRAYEEEQEREEEKAVKQRNKEAK